jgi:hypothetical protein
VISGTRVDIPLRVYIVACGSCISMLLLTIVAGVEAFVAAKCRMAGLAVDLARYFVTMTTMSAATTATKSSITAAMHVTTTTSTTTTKGSIYINLLLLLLSLDSSLRNQQLGIQIIESLRFCLGREGFDEWIEVYV